MKKRLGYNVIELLVVITAISLISAIAYKGVNVLLNNIKAEQLSSQLRQIKIGLGQYYADTGTYPTKLSELLTKTAPLDATIPDEFDAISVAYYNINHGDPTIPDYWAGPYLDGMKAQNDCIKSVVGYEICYGANYISDGNTSNTIRQLYTKTWSPDQGGVSIKQDPTASNKFYNVLSVNGVESAMAIKLFETLNHRGIDPVSHEKTKTIVYRFTEAF